MTTFQIVRNRKSALAALSLFVFAGCDDNPMVSVRGKVTFDGQACPGPGRIMFTPIEAAAGMPTRPASGAFSTDGVYEAGSFKPGDGLYPGRYQVGVACYDSSKLSGAPSDADFRKANYVSDNFQPPELLIEEGSAAMQFDLDVEKR